MSDPRRRGSRGRENNACADRLRRASGRSFRSSFTVGDADSKEAVTPLSYLARVGPKAFTISLALIAGLVAVSAMPGIGVMVGLFFAFSIAFFAAPTAFALQWALGRAGLVVTFETVLIGLLIAYGGCVLAGSFRAFRSFAAGDRVRARLICAKAALFAALPLAAYVSSDVLAKAWR